jgi:DNA-binding response OmpR family regulator
MYRILIVEDEPNMRLGLKDNLEFDGYTVDLAEDGPTGLNMILSNTFDLIVLDVMMPGMSGFDVCKTTRQKGITTPIILLTAKGEEIDKVRGLELGADDYITKPFSLREFLARVKAVLRRSQMTTKSSESSNGITLGRLRLNLATCEAWLEDVPVKLTHKEFELIGYLLKNKNKIVSRDSLLQEVWGLDNDINTRTIDNFIVRIRQKIEPDPDMPRIILTVHGVGYKLVEA